MVGGWYRSPRTKLVHFFGILSYDQVESLCYKRKIPTSRVAYFHDYPSSENHCVRCLNAFNKMVAKERREN